jgi:pyruvate,orthophosphate dikinase
MGIRDGLFEEVLTQARAKAGVASDTELKSDDWIEVLARFKAIVSRQTGHPFPSDPTVQLRMGIEAVFKSWNGKRAVD